MTAMEHELAETLRVVLETRGATFAAIASALREVERRLLATATAVTTMGRVVNGQAVVDADDALRLRMEVVTAASAIAAVASLVETPLTTEVVLHEE